MLLKQGQLGKYVSKSATWKHQRITCVNSCFGLTFIKNSLVMRRCKIYAVSVQEGSGAKEVIPKSRD